MEPAPLELVLRRGCLRRCCFSPSSQEVNDFESPDELTWAFVDPGAAGIGTLIELYEVKGSRVGRRISRLLGSA